MICRNRGEEVYPAYKRWILCGLLGVLVLFALTLTAAIICVRFASILSYRVYTMRMCLFLSALFCGCASARTAAQKRFLNALAGEGVLLIAVSACTLAFHDGNEAFPYLIDVGIMFFGAFAGTIIGTVRKKQRSGKR